MNATPPRSARRYRVILAAFLFACSMWMLAAMPAGAVEVTSSAVDHLERADLAVRLSSADPTGTVMLLIDGTVVDARPAAPGQSVDFGTIDLAPGTHRVLARIGSRTAPVESRPLSLRIWEKPLASKLVSPSSYAALRTSTAVRVGLSTTKLDMYLNGRRVNSRSVREGTLASMGTLELAQGVNTVTLVSSNPVSSTTSTFNIRRLEFPWATCIVIDKSDYKLYWVKDGVLVKAYPIAVGKAHTPTPVGTWRIDAKYHTDPSGVYGPRKMRMFRQTSSGYVFTAYNIHGTNQPWVIGTMASHGCIRLYNSDILELFPQVPLGTMVQTRE